MSGNGMEDWKRELKKTFPRLRLDEPMAEHTTFRIGGPAEAYLEAQSPAELKKACRFCRKHRVPVFFLGFGSNLLVLDGGIPGLVLRLAGDFQKVRRLGGGKVHAGAAVRIPKLVTQCAEWSLSGLEPLVGVPGTVGGALVMNAGTRQGEIGERVIEIEVLQAQSMRKEKIPKDQAGFSYRQSLLRDRWILGALLQLKRGSKVDIIEKIRQFQKVRLHSQPVHTFNVGSIFKNPPGKFSAQLIEQAGLKGVGVGGARVSPVHANFIENQGKAKAREVLELIETVRERVFEKFGVRLETEIQVVGRA